MIERQENGRGPRDSMARWTRPDGREVLTPATTMCWRPRYPQVRRARRDGCETVLRCGDCPGCREFEVLRLERRLVETYRAIAAAEVVAKLTPIVPGSHRSRPPRPSLFALRVYCPKGKHASTSRRIHRWRGVSIELGFFRAGVDSFIVLSREPSELVARLRRRRFRVHVRPVGRLDRARSWRDVARGLIVAREAYGENINRWYRRGLAPADKMKWEVRKLDAYKPFDKATDHRVDSESHGRLVPPRMWKLQDAVSVDARKLIDKADSPEKVVEALRPVFERLERMGGRRSISIEPISAEQIERNRRAYQHVARGESEALVNAKLSEFLPPPFIGGVTELLDNSSSQIGRPMSSIHSSGAPPPRTRDSIRAEAEAAEASEKHRSDFLAQRANKKIADAINRLRALVERRNKDSDR